MEGPATGKTTEGSTKRPELIMAPAAMEKTSLVPRVRAMRVADRTTALPLSTAGFPDQ
jgi:hypothetical protein